MTPNNSEKKTYSLEEVIVSEKFLVKHILSESRIKTIEINLTPRDQMGNSINEKGEYFDDIFDDKTHFETAEIGIETKYEISVEPINKNCPIKILTFYGERPQVMGDMIINAKIFSGERIINYKLITFEERKKGIKPKPTEYKKYELKEKESAFEIQIYNKENKVISTMRSIEYGKLFKDSLFRNYL